MKKSFFIFLLLQSFLFSTQCSLYYSPKKFYEAPEMLIEILDEHLPKEVFPKNGFKKELIKNQEIIKEDSFIEQGDYIYPIENGFWKYKKKDNRIDEINIARVEIYRFSDFDIANTINEEFENYWNDYIENAYEMQLTPEQTLFRYNKTYFTMSVFIYGVKGDTTPLKGTVVNLWLKDYTKEVNAYIQCMKEKNDSWW